MAGRDYSSHKWSFVLVVFISVGVYSGFRAAGIRNGIRRLLEMAATLSDLVRIVYDHLVLDHAGDLAKISSKSLQHQNFSRSHRMQAMMLSPG